MTTAPLTTTIRPARDEADCALMAEIARQGNRADDVDSVMTAEDIANRVRNHPNGTPEDDLLVLEAGGQLAAWQETHWRREDSGAAHYNLFGYVHPAWRRMGLGAQLLRRGEQRLRALAAQHTAQGFPPGFFQTFTPATRAGKVALFEREGYRVARHFYDMVRPSLDDLPDPALPPGFELRPAPRHDRAVLRQIWDANEEAFRDHWGFTLLGDADFNRLLESSDFDPSLWRVAWDTAANAVAGVAMNTISEAQNVALNRRRGWTDDLSVRRPYRKRGLGRALLVNSLLAFRERGMTEAGLGVDTENLSGALRLYENAGYQPRQHSLALRKPMTFEAP
ncbi:MAG: GNAT family N-acetyltransferase [Anaerolineales bacterium]|nr:GNAT family N-acetyltransferase [Anaerolineales bacterium]